MVWNFFKKKNEKGSSILILLIASIMITVFGFSVYRFILSVQNFNFVKASNTKYWLLAASLRDVIGRPENCIKVFKDKVYLSTEEEIEFELSDIDEDVFNIKDFLPEVADEITEAKFVLIPDDPNLVNDIIMSDDPNAGEQYYTFKANLEVRFKIGENMGFNYERLNVKIPLYINIDDSDKIYSCYSLNTPAYACESRGGAWNPEETNLDKMCNPDETCRTYAAGMCPDVIKPSEECPVYADKVIIGETTQVNIRNYSGAGEHVKNDIVTSIKNELDRGLVGVGSVDGGISSEVDNINDREYKKNDCPRRQPYSCCFGTPPNNYCTTCHRTVRDRTCYVYPGVSCSLTSCETVPPLEANNYISKARTKLDRIKERVAEEVASEINDYEFGKKIHSVYKTDKDACGVEGGCTGDDPSSCSCTDDSSSCPCAEKAVTEGVDQEGKKTELDSIEADPDKIREIVRDEMIGADNTPGALVGMTDLEDTHKEEIISVIQQKVLDILDYERTKKAVKTDAKKAVAFVMHKIKEIGSGGDGITSKKICACYWCNKYRYPPPN